MISIWPDDGHRVLIGTRQGGAYTSFDGGSSWWQVTHSSEIQFATSDFWLPGCAAADVGTWGRGIFRIDTQLHVHVVRTPQEHAPQQPCQPVVCRLEHDLAERIRNPHPVPSSERGWIVTDGYITAVRRQRNATIVHMTAGATLARVNGTPARVKTESVPWRPPAKQVIQAVLFQNGKLEREVKGAAPLELYPLRDTKPTGRVRRAPTALATVRFPSQETLFGNAFPNVAPGQPFTILVTPTKKIDAPLVIEIDGQAVAKYPARLR